MTKPKRPFYTDLASENSGRSFVDLVFTTDSSGDVDETVFDRAIEDVDHSTTGTYVVTFNNAWVQFMGGAGGVIQALTYDKTKATRIVVLENLVDDPDEKTITLGVTKSDGTLVDPVADDKVFFTFTLQWNNASARGVNT